MPMSGDQQVQAVPTRREKSENRWTKLLEATQQLYLTRQFNFGFESEADVVSRGRGVLVKP